MKIVSNNTDKWCLLLGIQQAIGLATIGSNILKIIIDLYLYTISYSNTMDQEIARIDNIINNLKVTDYYCLDTKIYTKRRKNLFVYSTNVVQKKYFFCTTFPDLDEEGKILQNIETTQLDNKTISGLKQRATYYSPDTAVDKYFNCSQDMYLKVLYGSNSSYDLLIQAKYNRDITELGRAREFCELDKPKLLRHIAYVIIGLIRCLPIFGTLYSIAALALLENGENDQFRSYRPIFNNDGNHFKNTQFSKYHANPLDTYR